MPESLERREPLDRVQELRGKAGIGFLAAERVRGLAPVPKRGREERHQREAHHDRGYGQIDERHSREDQQRRQQRDQELRQELAEIGLELLHAIDQRECDRARALRADGRRTQRRDLVIDPAAEPLLHARGGLVRDHGAPMLEDRAERDHHGDTRDGQRQRAEIASLEDLADQPAKQTQPRHAESDRH